MTDTSNRQPPASPENLPAETTAAEHMEKPDASVTSASTEKAGETGKTDKADKAAKSEKSARPAKPTESGRKNAEDRGSRAEKTDKSGKAAKAAKAAKAGKEAKAAKAAKTRKKTASRARNAATDDPLIIGGTSIPPGTSMQIQLPVARLYTNTEMAMPVQVIRGKKPGPKVFVCAAIHGDELNGMEIIRRLLQRSTLKLRRGTLVAVPIVNVYGVLHNERYMPDRRDLNRCFPGSQNGSLARRVAHKFMREVVSQCDYGIDLHTGGVHRSNLPQIRANLSDPELLELAKAFGVPVLIDAHLRDGSLRKEAADANTRVLLYEAGEALRFDELSIRAGVNGVMHILSHLRMLKRKRKRHPIRPFVADKSAWIRASCSGIVTSHRQLGAYIRKGDILATIGNPYGEEVCKVVSSRSGILIGRQNIPLVQEGDAMFHIAYFEESARVDAHIDLFEDHVLPGTG